jgi:hypothetical protein
MSNVRVICLMLIGVLSGIAVGTPETVEANHTSGWFNSAHWTNDPPILVGWLEPELGYGAELTNTLNRVVAAAGTWSSVANSTWDPYYDSYSTYYQWTGSVCASVPAGYALLTSYNVSAVASTNRAYCSNKLTSTTRWDTDVTWYNDASTASLPAGQHDLQGNLTHELAHVAGLKSTHLTGSVACPGVNNSSQSTMCDKGSTNFYWRSLTSHDISIMAYEY